MKDGGPERGQKLNAVTGFEMDAGSQKVRRMSHVKAGEKWKAIHVWLWPKLQLGSKTFSIMYVQTHRTTQPLYSYRIIHFFI